MAKLKLTDKIQTDIVQALQAGSFVQPAVEAAGISESGFWRYMQQGADALAARAAAEELGKKWTPQKHDERMIEFWEAVTRARATAEIHAVASVRRAMPDDWRAAAFYLERAHPKRWGKRLQAAAEEQTQELTAAQAALAAEAMRNAVISLGFDPSSDEMRLVMRNALTGASG